MDISYNISIILHLFLYTVILICLRGKKLELMNKTGEVLGIYTLKNRGDG